MTTKKQLKVNAKRFAPYVSELARRMRLYDWTISVSYDAPDNEEAAAAVDMIYGRKMAKIFLAADFHTFSREQQRHYLVHELVHCHWEPTMSPVRHLFKSQSWQVLRCSFEYSTDAMAEIIAPYMPLPPLLK